MLLLMFANGLLLLLRVLFFNLGRCCGVNWQVLKEVLKCVEGGIDMC